MTEGGAEAAREAKNESIDDFHGAEVVTGDVRIVLESMKDVIGNVTGRIGVIGMRTVTGSTEVERIAMTVREGVRGNGNVTVAITATATTATGTGNGVIDTAAGHHDDEGGPERKL